MFARSGSSPKAPPGKATKQTSLDLYSRPSTRLAKKEARAKGPGEAAPDAPSRPKSSKEAGSSNTVPVKGKTKRRATGTRGAPWDPGSDHSEDSENATSQAARSEVGAGESGTSQAPTRVIHNAEEGRLYLEEEALIDTDEHINLDTMAGALVQLSAIEGISTPVGLAVRAVALILAQMKMESVCETLLKMVEPKLDSIMGKAADKLAELEVAAETTIVGLRAATQGVSDSTDKLAETSTNYRDALLRHPPQPGPPNPPLLPHLPSRLKAREGIKSRQVLVELERELGTGQVPFADESIAALKSRIDRALRDGEPSTEHKTRAVTRLRNGGILMEMESEGAAGWFADEDVRKRFLEKFHASASIKPRLYHTVIQFVPLTFKTNRAEDLREVEEANGIAAGDIASARWIKPAARRKPSQTCGHLILSFRSPQPANDTLAFGLFICQKKVYAEKCKREPLRCLKCHGWGHMAANCTAPNDICGTCALPHRTSSCTTDDHLRCVSCKVTGHASWARNCPVFLQKCYELNERVDENNMPYFPTQEAWTQVMEPPRAAPVLQPRSREAPLARGGMTQTRLPWQRNAPPANGPPPRGVDLPPQRQPRWEHGEHDSRDGPPHLRPHHPSHE